jgi:hypothetical protein
MENRKIITAIIVANAMLLGLLLYLLTLVESNAEAQPNLTPTDQVELMDVSTPDSVEGRESPSDQSEATETQTPDLTKLTETPAANESQVNETPPATLVPAPVPTFALLPIPTRAPVPTRVDIGGPTKAPYVFPTPVYVPLPGRPTPLPRVR